MRACSLVLNLLRSSGGVAAYTRAVAAAVDAAASAVRPAGAAKVAIAAMRLQHAGDELRRLHFVAWAAAVGFDPLLPVVSDTLVRLDPDGAPGGLRELRGRVLTTTEEITVRGGRRAGRGERAGAGGSRGEASHAAPPCAAAAAVGPS